MLSNYYDRFLLIAAGVIVVTLINKFYNQVLYMYGKKRCTLHKHNIAALVIAMI